MTRDSKERLTALLHHINVDTLHESYLGLRQEAAAGVDRMRWDEYKDGLEERLLDLHDRVHAGTYRAQPVRRVEIPKPDGGKRPLGIAALEDKILQKAMVDCILTPIYEAEFQGFSYGFRPGRGAHDALDALAYGIERRKVSWIVDADIRGYLELSSYCSPIDASCASMSLLSHNPFCFSALRHDYGDRPVAGSSDLTHCNSALQAMRRARTGSGGHRRGA